MGQSPSIRRRSRAGTAARLDQHRDAFERASFASLIATQRGAKGDRWFEPDAGAEAI
jgi:hypothetical protein